MGHCGQRAKSVTSLLLGHLDSSAKLGFGDRALFRELSLSLEEIALGPGGMMSNHDTLQGGEERGGPIRPAAMVPAVQPAAQVQGNPPCPLWPRLRGSDTGPCFMSCQHGFYEQTRCQ